MNDKILLVDDELNVLNAYKRSLRKKFDFDMANSGKQALELVAGGARYSVIVSDMRMPEMEGVELLSRFKKVSPETVRVMLTGNSDQQTAIDAINEGDIFRFLNKPCSPDQLAHAIEASIQQHHLIIAERELLQKTLRGSIRALSEVLSLVNPEAFGRVGIHRKMMKGIADYLKIGKVWWVEPLAMLSQIGCVILPDRLLTKIADGTMLNGEEYQLFRQHPMIGSDLIAKIPRMEKIAKGIRYQEKEFDGGGVPMDQVKGEDIPLGARMLKVVIDYDRHTLAGLSEQQALQRMQKSGRMYDPEIVLALEFILFGDISAKPVEIEINELSDGMTLAEDVVTKDGLLMVSKGMEVNSAIRNIIMNFAQHDNIKLPLVVFLE